MVNTFLALTFGTIVGFLPTFGLLFIITNRFQEHINEEDTIKTFVIGIFAGILVTLGHLFVIQGLDAESAGPFVIYAYLLALAEALMWRVYLRRRKFRDRPDRPFILLSFALGISGLFLIFTFGQLLTQFDTSSGVFIEQLLGFALFAVALSTMRGAMSLILSQGEMKGKSLVPMVVITLIFGTFNLFALIYLAYEFLWTFAAILVPIGMIAFAITYRNLKQSLITDQ
jgi:hypothetical protein